MEGSTMPWYPNTAVNYHITPDLANLRIAHDYNGHDQLHVGNGQALQITHIGSGVQENLPCRAQVKMECTLSPNVKQAFTAKAPTMDEWHVVLGHPQRRIVSSLIKQFHLPCSSLSGPSFTDSLPLCRTLVFKLQRLILLVYSSSRLLLVSVLFFSKHSTLDLQCFTDSDWGGCPDESRSTNGYAIYLGKNLISWTSKKQPTIARFPTESDYRALANSTVEIMWLRSLSLNLVSLLKSNYIVRLFVKHQEQASALFFSAFSLTGGKSSQVCSTITICTLTATLENTSQNVHPSTSLLHIHTPPSSSIPPQPSSTITPHHTVLGGWRWPRDEYAVSAATAVPNKPRTSCIGPREDSFPPQGCLQQPSHKKASLKSTKLFRHFRSVFRSFPIISPACKIPVLLHNSRLNDVHIHGGTRMTVPYSGTARGGFLAIQESPRCFPIFLLELAIPPASSSKIRARAG
ncbi:putative mitochondrial protein [Vitis vinifera]|uniref:Putative mitochondrial protein n=1 Tax=Vitis vinifera TaxID=29760 RepID=A0A438CEI4_VITVI|nr:putative mitochondrial protein [Vitis vinifera]